MTQFKGTPGPWFEYREGFSTVYIEAKLRYGVIQEVAACGPTEAGQEAQSANARLIAAAPELLAALIKCADALEEVSYQAWCGEIIEEALAAINKVTGETK